MTTEFADAAEGREALWAAVIGQPETVESLRSVVADPVHAYMLVGPAGSGKMAAARALAAELLSQGLDEPAALRAVHLVANDAHPSFQVIERTGASIQVDEIREIVKRAGMAPPEGYRQVLVLDDFHLVSENAAPALLKSLEEPSDRTIFIVLAEEVPPALVTIASRCSQFELHPIAESVLSAALVAEGVEETVARAAAASSAGDLDRARLLVNDPDVGARDAAWYAAPDRLDGSGATACRTADELAELTEQVLAPLAERQADDVAALEASYAALEEDVPKGRMKALTDRHKREERRLRNDMLKVGLAAVLRRYRDGMADGDDPATFLAAAAAVQRLSDALAFNPNEGLQLRALFSSLPTLSPRR